MDAAEKKRMLSAYLRGTLSEDERRRLEAEYATDDALFEELIEIENDTIDSQARDVSSAATPIRLVERSEATTVRAQRARFARALAGLQRAGSNDEPLPATSQGPPRGAPGTIPPGDRGRVALPVALAALAAGLVLLVLTNARLREELISLRGEVTALRDDLATLRDERDGLRRASQDVARPVERPAERTQSPGPPGRTGSRPPRAPLPVRLASVRLLAGGGRAPGDPQTLRILPGTELAELRLDLEHDDHPRYRAVLQTAEGRPVATRSNLESRRDGAGESIVVLRLPVSDLPAGDYIVRLTGLTASGATEPVDAYTLTVVQAPRPRE